MKVIDRLGEPLTVTFGDLAIDEGFIDEDGDTNIKIGIGCTMYWSSDHWVDRHMEDDTLIIPIEVTYIFERKDKQ
jgi:hypothetical protein